MEREIQTAREVQTALLPESYWSAPHFAVHGTCVPCLDLGGDYVGQFRLSDGRVAHVVADVCGKGIPASLFAVNPSCRAKRLRCRAVGILSDYKLYCCL